MRAAEMNQVQTSKQVTHQTGETMRPRSCQVRRQARARRKRGVSGLRVNLDLQNPSRASHLFRQLSLVLAAWFALWAAQGAVHCLRISSIEIPPAIWNGSETTLACNYELAPKDQLYSVKWYKDYVEFYRFQPPPAVADQTSGPSQPPPPDITASTSEQPGEPAAGGENLNLNYQISPNSKHEFELEGINLDLSKSNATHVHLRAVGLSTEAIFKCEISADSPTFATVSAERQMKVYVLPKQKLTLTETSAQRATSVQVPQAPASNSHQQHANNLMQLNVYQLNDLINFTCASSAARPAARLTWLLNDVPLSSLSLSGPPPADVLEMSQVQSSPRPQLVETRSNLALRLQAHHLRQLAGTLARNRNQVVAQYQAGSSYLPLKLTCLAQMALEFASESSILISGGGGKAGTSKRSKPRDGVHLGGGEPLAASWQRGNAAADTDHEDQLVTHNPRKRLQLDPTMAQVGDGESANEEPESPSQRLIVSAYRWPPALDRLQRTNKQRRQQQQQHALDWGSVAPPIGAESHHRFSERRTTAQQPVQAAAAAGTRHIIVWTTRQLRAQSEHIEQLLRPSGANQLEAPQIEARTISTGDEPPEGSSSDGSESSPLEVDPYEATPPVVAGTSGSPLNNYELNERVNFTCYHQGPTAEHLSVQLRWFLNERELTADFINAFDGSKFYASGPGGSNLTTPTAGRPNSSSNGRASAAPKEGPAAQRSLVIEFTPSLFQLKELSLKCKSTVEQPLIEFEQSQLLHLATSPFIHAQLPPPPQPPPPPVATNPRPSLYQVKHRQQQQQSGDPRQRASVIRMRQSSRSSGSAGVRGGQPLSPLAALTLALWSSLLLLLLAPHDCRSISV